MLLQYLLCISAFSTRTVQFSPSQIHVEAGPPEGPEPPERFARPFTFEREDPGGLLGGEVLEGPRGLERIVTELAGPGPELAGPLVVDEPVGLRRERPEVLDPGGAVHRAEEPVRQDVPACVRPVRRDLALGVADITLVGEAVHLPAVDGVDAVDEAVPGVGRPVASRPKLHGLAVAGLAARGAVRTGERAEQVVERPVLLDQEDHVLDLRARQGDRSWIGCRRRRGPRGRRGCRVPVRRRRFAVTCCEQHSCRHQQRGEPERARLEPSSTWEPGSQHRRHRLPDGPPFRSVEACGRTARSRVRSTARRTLSEGAAYLEAHTAWR